MSEQLSLLDRAKLTPPEVADIIQLGPIVHASEDGKTVYTVNGSYLNRFRRTPKGWDCDECRLMPANLYVVTVAAAMDLAERWHKDSLAVEDVVLPRPSAKSSRKAEMPPTEQLSDRQRELLASFDVNDNAATFRESAHIDDWAEVKKVFLALGAKWRTGKPGKFVFPEDLDGAERVRIALETGEIVDPRAAGFFPTPTSLAREVVRLAGVSPKMRVLEPSAGHGAIADAAREWGAVVDCCELLPDNIERLRRLGYVVHEGDFLTLCANDLRGPFDAVVMNPPFANQADINHVEHALQMVKPGGSLVSIMSGGVRFRDDAKTKAFRARVEAMGGEWIENAEGSFKESGTMVRTVTLVLREVA